jgi:hypothetical protein
MNASLVMACSALGKSSGTGRAPAAILAGPGQASCAEVREIAKHHIEHIRAKINDLAKLERLLRKTVAQCSGGKIPDCPVLDILDVQGLMTFRT